MTEVFEKIDNGTIEVINKAIVIMGKMTNRTGIDFNVVALLRDCILNRSMEEALIKSGIEFFYVSQDVQIRFVYDPIYN